MQFKSLITCLTMLGSSAVPVFSAELTSMLDLGTLGRDRSYARAISVDGAVIIGFAGSERAFKYTEAAGMQDLGTLGGFYAEPLSLSSNGSVIVGYSSTVSNAVHAFKYTDATGMVDLGTLGGESSFANAVSGNGVVVVGNSQMVGFNHLHAFKHTDATGMVDLGTLGGIKSDATAASADGSIVVGFAFLSGFEYHAFKHTDATGMVDLGTLGGSDSKALAISANGQVIVGVAEVVSSDFHAFKYTDASGMVDLGTLGGYSSAAVSVSNDGSVIVGRSDLADFSIHAFKYTDATGMVSLGTLGGSNSYATAVSADGSTIIGDSETAEGFSVAFRHTEKEGMISLGTLGGYFSYAFGVSGDGKVVVGKSETESGEEHAFVWREKSADVPQGDSPQNNSDNNTNGSVGGNGNGSIGTMIDVDNTLLAVGRNAWNSARLLDRYGSELNRLMANSCSSIEGNFCIDVRSGYQSFDSGHSRGSATLTLGWKVSPKVHLGFSVDQSLAERSRSGNVSTKNHSPSYAVFADYAESLDGVGLHAHIAGAYASDSIEIQRDSLPYTEAGVASSKVHGSGFGAWVSYGFEYNKGTKIAPYLAFTHTRVTRDAYNESESLAFPVAYGQHHRTVSRLSGGVRVEHSLTEKLEVFADFSIAYDLKLNQNNYVAKIPYVGNYAYKADAENQTRFGTGIGAKYNLSRQTALNVSAFWQQQAIASDAKGVFLSISSEF